MSERRFFYNGTVCRYDLPDYMYGLAGWHRFTMYKTDINEEARHLVDESKLWCLDQDFEFERMSNEIFIRHEINAMTFRLRWC